MPTTIREIQHSLQQFNKQAQNIESVENIQKTWKHIFHQNLTKKGAKTFLDYYKDMRSKTKKAMRSKTKKVKRSKTVKRRRNYKGGAAPINTTLTPGIFAKTYGNFPTEISSGAPLQDLDVYIKDSIIPGTFWPSPSETMGSNKVGGRRRSMRRNRKQKGGNLGESLQMRGFPIPFTATPYPNYSQTIANTWSGNTHTIPNPVSPVIHTWQPMSGGPASIINPGMITTIGSDFGKFASSPPWQTTN